MYRITFEQILSGVTHIRVVDDVRHTLALLTRRPDSNVWSARADRGGFIFYCWGQNEDNDNLIHLTPTNLIGNWINRGDLMEMEVGNED